jgi:hypothetical protein
VANFSRDAVMIPLGARVVWAFVVMIDHESSRCDWPPGAPLYLTLQNR